MLYRATQFANGIQAIVIIDDCAMYGTWNGGQYVDWQVFGKTIDVTTISGKYCRETLEDSLDEDILRGILHTAMMESF